MNKIIKAVSCDILCLPRRWRPKKCVTCEEMLDLFFMVKTTLEYRVFSGSFPACIQSVRLFSKLPFESYESLKSIRSIDAKCYIQTPGTITVT